MKTTMTSSPRKIVHRVAGSLSALLAVILSAFFIGGCVPVAWLPDSSGFIYTTGLIAGKPAYHQLILYDMATGGSRLLATTGACTPMPAISPDGTRVAVAALTTDANGQNLYARIFIYNLKGKEVHQSVKFDLGPARDNVAEFPGSQPGPEQRIPAFVSWAGSRIVVNTLSNRGPGRTGIYDPDTGSAKALSGVPCRIAGSPFRPDGKGMLLVRGEGMVWLDAKGEEKLFPFPANLPSGLRRILPGMQPCSSYWQGAVAILSQGKTRVEIDTTKRSVAWKTIPDSESLSNGRLILQQHRFDPEGTVVRVVETKADGSAPPVLELIRRGAQPYEGELMTTSDNFILCPSPDGKWLLIRDLTDSAKRTSMILVDRKGNVKQIKDPAAPAKPAAPAAQPSMSIYGIHSVDARDLEAAAKIGETFLGHCSAGRAGEALALVEPSVIKDFTEAALTKAIATSSRQTGALKSVITLPRRALRLPLNYEEAKISRQLRDSDTDDDDVSTMLICYLCEFENGLSRVSMRLRKADEKAGAGWHLLMYSRLPMDKPGWQVFELSANTGLAVALRAHGRPAAEWDPLIQAGQQLAKLLKVTIPALPAVSAEEAADRKAARTWLTTDFPNALRKAPGGIDKKALLKMDYGLYLVSMYLLYEREEIGNSELIKLAQSFPDDSEDTPGMEWARGWAVGSKFTDDEFLRLTLGMLAFAAEKTGTDVKGPLAFGLPRDQQRAVNDASK